MAEFIRARSPEQKEQRLDEIKGAVRRQFAERPYHEITLTTIAEELWITAVTSVPVITPMTTLPVTFSSTRFSAALELFFRPSPIRSMP